MKISNLQYLLNRKMSSKNSKVAPTQVEGYEQQSEAPTKVVQLPSEEFYTVSQMMSKASKLVKMSKDLDTLYVMRERLNSMFYGTGEEPPKEFKAVDLIQSGSDGYRESEKFRVSNPETVTKIRALVSVDLSDRIEELEKSIVSFRI